MWKRKINEERWKKQCNVMRENDTINVLSLFFFSSPEPDDYWMRSYQGTYAYRNIMDAFYPRIPSIDIKKTFGREEGEEEDVDDDSSSSSSASSEVESVSYDSDSDYDD